MSQHKSTESHSKKTDSPPKKRVRKLDSHRTLKLTRRRIKRPTPLPSIKSLVSEPFRLIWQNKKLYFGLTAIFWLLLFILTKGLGSAFDIVQTKQEVQEALGEEGQSLGTSYALFNYLLGSFNGQVTDVAGTYQLFITIIILLATIWITRQIFAGEKPRLRDGFYKGMYPLVPFIFILIVVSLQLLPALIGNFIFSTVITNGLAITFLEKVLWFLLFAGGLLLSLYMVLSSVFALNIVTLSDVAPLKALRSSRELVLHRRIGIFARILVLPIVGFLLALAIFLPMIMYAPVLVEPLFLVGTCFGLIFATVFMYNFYRKLL